MACCSCFTSLACQNEINKLLPTSRGNELEYFVDGKFLVCLYFELASLLQGLLLDERNLKGTPRGKVMMLASKEIREGIDHFVHLAEDFIIV